MVDNGRASRDSGPVEVTVGLVMHPVGPRPPAVYWVRRVIFIVVVIAVLVGVIFLVIGRTGAAKATDGGSGNGGVGGTVTPVLTGVLASPSVQGVAPPASSAPASAALPTPAAATGSATTSAGTTGPATPPASKTTPGSTPAGARPGSTASSGSVPKATGAAKTTAPATTSPKTTAPKGTAPTSPVTTAPVTPKTTAPAKTTAAPTGPPAKPTTPPASTSPTTATTTAPSTDARGRLLCADSVLKLVATTGAPQYAVGDQVVLGVAVTNSGAVDCTRDLSGPLQVFTVYTAAGARVWSTTDCFPGEGTDVRTLAAGTTVHYNIKWSGTSSKPGCAGVRSPVPAGRYQVRVDVGSLHAAPATLTIS